MRDQEGQIRISFRNKTQQYLSRSISSVIKVDEKKYIKATKSKAFLFVHEIMTSLAKFFDKNVYNKINREVNFNDPKYRGKIVGLYFSAHWCPPCRAFTPKLVEFYRTHAKEKNFEIIYISSDQDEQQYEEYYKEMPWLRFDFRQQRKRDKLMKVFKVSGIPQLILFDGDTGNILCTNAMEQIQYRDKKGELFPWKQH